MSWRDVPMPPGVAARPRTAGGLPIPFVAARVGEQSARIAPDPVLVRALGVRLPAIFSSDAPAGAHAQLGVMEPARQRRVVIERLCQVCEIELGDRHRPNPPWRTPLWLVDLRVSWSGHTAGEEIGNDVGGQTIRIRSKTCPLIFEPWVCEDCLAYSLQVCPGILKVAAGQHRHPLRLLRVRDARPVAVTAIVRGDGPIAGARGISYLKLAAVDFDIVLPERFLEDHQAVAA